MFTGQDGMKIPGYTGHQRGLEVVDERPNGPAQKKIPGKYCDLRQVLYKLAQCAVFYASEFIFYYRLRWLHPFRRL